MNKIALWSALVSLFFMGSCAVKKNLTYFNNLPEYERTIIEVNNKTEPRIKPDDELSIKVSTMNPEANALYNTGVLSSGSGSSGGGASSATETYRVDKNGNINYPVFGKIHLEGKTLEEARDHISQLISKEAKNPIVNVKFLNAHVTVLGEVGSAGAISINDRKTTILEALGKAGGIPPTGRRDNVMLMRENGNQWEITRLNMNDKATISSPYYYLQQNDIILVEPTRRKERQAAGVPDGLNLVTLSLSLLGTVIGLYLTIKSLR